MKIMTIPISLRMDNAIQKLVDAGFYTCRSEVVRCAAHTFLLMNTNDQDEARDVYEDSHDYDTQKAVATINFPVPFLAEISDAVHDKRFLNRSHYIRVAVHNQVDLDQALLTKHGDFDPSVRPPKRVMDDEHKELLHELHKKEKLVELQRKFREGALDMRVIRTGWK